MDALFTATSAVCVTGQVTLNTAEQLWNYFGKTVIITLIEIGGLGFMSIIVMFFVFIGKRLNLRQRLIVREAINTDSLSDAQFLIRYIIRFSLTIQAIGASLLAIDFIPRFGILKGIYFSVFHSISAFCNAGFDLLETVWKGFTPKSTCNPYNWWFTSRGWLRVYPSGSDVLSYRRNRKLLMHTKLTLITTLSILGSKFFTLLVK
ncbi:potassium transporter TrkG [Erysipelothrix piscisicarius]|uniref:potassium transporter TrkG n=1 Tax=Erysipelothrix piscisicarius TaxID=2485784 RepID=UPI002F956BAF